jgi:hypothetical protein
MAANSRSDNFKLYDIPVIIFLVNNYNLSSGSRPPCKCTNLGRLYVMTAWLDSNKKELTLLCRTRASSSKDSHDSSGLNCIKQENLNVSNLLPIECH